MGENKFQVIYKDKIEKETIIPVQDIDRELGEKQNEANLVRVNEEGTALMQVKHEFINIGESIAQIKYSTSAQVTKHGTIKVVQFKQQINSRGEDIFYFSNDTGVFEGTLEDAIKAFPNVSFEELKIPELKYQDNPEFGRIPILPNTAQNVKWTNNNYYDSEENGGKPTNWDNWADNTQTALDAIGLIPGIGEFADCANGVISLVRGNYSDAALSFAAMIPFFGTAATVTKQARKFKKLAKVNKEANEGVYDLIVKNKNEVENYIGKSKNVFERFIQHFNPKRGKLATKTLDRGSLYHKMKGAIDYEMEMVENWLILKKYGKNWKASKKSGELKKLLNKRNPVGGRHNLKTSEGIKDFMNEAEEIIDKFDGLRESLEKSMKIIVE
jgi:hypothetical protein